MKHQWTVARRGTPRPDAPRRWDRAYLVLLRLADEVPEAAAIAPAPPPPEESRRAGSHLRARFDPAPSANPRR